MIFLLVLIVILFISIIFYIWYIFKGICNNIESIDERLMYYEKRDGERYREIRGLKNEIKELNSVQKKGSKK